MYDDVSSEKNLMPLSEDAVNAISDFVFAPASASSVDYLVVLGTPHIELTEEAAKAYHAGLAKRIIASGKYSSKHGRVLTEKLPERYRMHYETEAEMISTILQKMNVPESCIICEQESTNIRENIEYSLQLANSDKNTSMGICCQSFCARRALLTFQSLSISEECSLFIADTQGISKSTWHKNEYGRARVLGELVRIGTYFR